MIANTKPIPIKLFIGFIYQDEEIYSKTKPILKKKFGLFDFESKPLAFNHTAYYNKEFGQNLKRRFLSFESLVNPAKLSIIKKVTNKIEMALSFRGNLRINIDPGLLSLSKVVLATTKDYKHRIYLNNGIYAESTLYFQNKKFNPWEWTYPDYKTPAYIEIFNKIRQIYLRQLEKK